MSAFILIYTLHIVGLIMFVVWHSMDERHDA
jgi:hypothetical protein